MVLDGLDGRVARLTHTQSEFGAEYDSLSDMVSFGAAPALVMYEWALKDLGKHRLDSRPSSTAPAAALRLARFNTNIEVVDKRFFQGLPSPAAAALVAGFIWVVDDFGFDRVDWIRYLAVHHHALRGRHDGGERAVLQLQGLQPAEARAVLGRACGNRLDCGHRIQAGNVPVPACSWPIRFPAT